MRRVFKFVFASVICFLSSTLLFAQSTYYSVQIYIEKAYFSGYVGDEYGPRIRLYKDDWRDEPGYALWWDDNCAKLPNVTYGMVDVNRTFYTSLSSSSPEFDLIVVTHEERKAGSTDCTVQGVAGVTTKKPDRFQASVIKHINLNDYSPGVYSPTFTVTTESGSTYVYTYLKIRYTPVPLDAPYGPGGQHCSNEDFTVSTKNSFSSSTNTTGLQYDWEYHISGDTEPNPDFVNCQQTCWDDLYNCQSYGNTSTYCYSIFGPCYGNCSTYYPAEVDNWVPFRTTSTPYLTFNPLNDIFGSLSANTNVQFRVKPRGPETANQNSAGGTYFTFTPPPPSSTSIAFAEKSCTASPTGKITLDNISSVFSTYKYILKKGDVATLGCDPNAGNCFTDIQTFGTNSGSTLQLTGIPYGTYSLFLLNNGGVQGVCPRRIGGAIAIDTVTRIGANPLSISNLTCNGVNEGSVSVTIFNGKTDAVNYDLQNLTTSDSYTLNSSTANATVAFPSLAPGSFRLVVNDGCTPPVVRTFDITQPVKFILDEFDSTNATCNVPGNGVADIKVTRSSDDFDKSISTLNHYQLFNEDGSLFDEQETDAASFRWSTLPPGNNYKIVVTEKNGLLCNGYTNVFSIAGPEALGVNSLVSSDVLCNGGSDGKITVTGKGGTGSYIFTLSGNSTDSNSIGLFDTLTAGDYVITVKNSISCSDQYVHPVVTIHQPSQVTASISKKDISCYGLTDGEITSIVGGGTGSGYSYLWETLINNSWMSTSIITPTLSGRGEGDYRLSIKDGNQCAALSNEVSIIEPAILNIDSVDVHDIKCFAEKGTIQIYASGGVTPYKYEYSYNSSPIYKDFTSSTALDAGTYAVKVKDNNNCSYQHTDDHIITTPAVALDFTMVLSDFNGFNISCYGGSNGSVILTASGGNGADYSGYTYAVDANTFQIDTKLESINAGDHSLRVKDDRGCVVSKIVNFTQTSAKLTPQLVQKKDVACFGDTDGLIEMSGTGGLSPFQYRINDSALQSDGLFTGLAIGEYTITIIDKNNCDNNFIESITNINPAIEITSSVMDVNCFEGQDGSIQLAINGGVSPFQYKWTGLSTTTTMANNLKTGTYNVEVTDNAGCKMSAAIFVNQPAASLKIGFLALPVCYDRTDGSISIWASGGTSPYFYSIDDGQNFQTPGLFPAVGVGSYKIKAKDKNECSTTALAEVIKRNDKPEPNFLAATKRNALDTLLITEISVPKPDSIFWIFDPKATVISNDQWNPQIKFSEPGTYFVSMTGFFHGCDYSVTKDLFVSPFDPNATPDKNPLLKPITSFSVTPNPSAGEFNVSVTLNKKRNLSIVVYDVVGGQYYNQNWEGVQEVNQKVVLNNVSSGIYVVRVITETDSQDARMVINK